MLKVWLNRKTNFGMVTGHLLSGSEQLLTRSVCSNGVYAIKECQENPALVCSAQDVA